MLELYFLETSAAVTNKEQNGQADSKAAVLSWLCCNNILCENGKAVPIPNNFCHSYWGKGIWDIGYRPSSGSLKVEAL